MPTRLGRRSAVDSGKCTTTEVETAQQAAYDRCVSVAVSLEQLHARVSEFGEHAYLTTLGSDGRAHVVSVHATVDGDRVRVRAGRTSTANVGVNPAVTLLWAAPVDGPYCLIVDGDGTIPDEGEGETEIRPTRAVLHRVIGASHDLPSCIPLEQSS